MFGVCDVDVRRVIPARNFVMWHRAHERDTGKSKVAREPAERRLLGSAPDDGQRGVGIPVRYDPERSKRALEVVQGLEVSRRQQARPRTRAATELELVETHGVVHDPGRDSKP